MLNADFKKLEEFFGKDKPQATVPQKKQATPTKPAADAQPAHSTPVAKSVNLKKKSQKESINDARRKRTAASLISKPLASILKGEDSD
ncbi:unnamed protein product [Cylicostephanus goldi]|uniref:Uncharacterized protein n=1 Tax=Cylicostephanus goldi TaxID=71465 RepID=A0A3P6RKL1_CYLGO|nr:unnamed protein product [Cylicostephanus goldi]